MNPLFFSIGRMALPYLIAGAVGFGIAWQIQGLRITAAKQEFTDYKQEQIRLIQEAKENADRQRDADARRYAEARRLLTEALEAGSVLRRCIAAGKCVGMPNVPANPGIGVSPAGRIDGPSLNAIPSAGAPTAGVIFDCAYTTLQLNQLQASIESQTGYVK